MTYITRDDPVSVFSFGVRAMGCLMRSKLRTVGDLLDYMSKNSLRSLQNLGKMTQIEIESAINDALRDHVNYYFVEDSISSLSGDDFDSVVNYNLDTRVEDMPFSESVRQHLSDGGVVCVRDLIDYSSDDLVSKFGVLKAQADRIRCFLDRYDDPSMNFSMNYLYDIADDFVHAYGGSQSLYARAAKVTVQSNYGISESEIIQRLYYLGSVRAAVKLRIMDLLAYNFDGISDSALDTMLPVHLVSSPVYQVILYELVAENLIELKDGLVIPVYPKVISYVENMPQSRVRDMFLERLHGNKLSVIGKKYNLTRERVRQVTVRFFSDMKLEQPIFYEDRYIWFYDHYQIHGSDMRVIFGEDENIVSYLDLACENKLKDKKPLKSAFEDPSVSESIKQKLLVLFSDEVVMLDGELLHKDYLAIARHILKGLSNDEIAFVEFQKICRKRLEDANVDGIDEIIGQLRVRELSMQSERCALWSRGHYFRYYDIDSRDYTALFKALDLDQYKDVEYSTLKFFRDNASLMRRYDIRNEYELHNLLRKLLSNLRKDIRFKKMPMVEFGNVDRRRQVLNFYEANKPISMKDFADRYEQVYGVRRETIVGSYFVGIEDLFVKSDYCLDDGSRLSSLTNYQANQMKNVLTKDYYSMDSLKAIYKDVFRVSDTSHLNSATIRGLGYLPYRNYVVSSKYASAAECFRSMLLKDDFIDVSSFDDGLTSVSAYAHELMVLRVNADLIEYEPQQFVNQRWLEDHGITKDMIRDFVEAVSNFVEDDQLFTLKYLIDNGFDHSLLHCDIEFFSDWTYMDMLANVGDLFNYQRLGNVKIFCKRSGVDILSKFFGDIVRGFGGKMNIGDMIRVLNDIYGIKVHEYKVVDIVRRVSELSYDARKKQIFCK